VVTLRGDAGFETRRACGAALLNQLSLRPARR
jgi:hypothetical protein